MNFIEIEIIYPDKVKGKMLRMRTSLTMENLKDNKKIQIEAGSIGYCYACNFGSLFLGFEKETKKVPFTRSNPTLFPIIVQFNTSAVFRVLEIEK